MCVRVRERRFSSDQKHLMQTQHDEGSLEAKVQLTQSKTQQQADECVAGRIAVMVEPDSKTPNDIGRMQRKAKHNKK